MEKKEFGKREMGTNRTEKSRGDSGKKEYGKRDAGKKEFVRGDSVKKEYGKTDSGKREFGKKEYGKKEFGKKEFGKPEPGKREYGKSEPGKREYGKSEPGKREYGKKEYVKEDSGNKSFGRGDAEKKDFGKRDFGKTDSGNRSFSRGDAEKKDFGKRDFGKMDSSNRSFGRGDAEKKDFGKRDFGKREYGKTDSGNRSFGRGDAEKKDFGKREYGKTDSGNRSFGRGDAEKKDFGKKEFGRGNSEKKDFGRSDFVKRDFVKKDFGKTEPGKKYFIKGGSKVKKFVKKKIDKAAGDDEGSHSSSNRNNRGDTELRSDTRQFTGESTEQNSYEKSKGKLCPVYNKCGGCQLLHLPYRKQLEQKQTYIDELLKEICPVKPIIGMKEPFHYRNKVHAVFDHDKKGNALSGVYKEGTHIVIPVERCMIEDEKADEIIGTIRGMLRSFKILTYDEDTGFGFMRHALVKCGFATGEIMVVLVTASPIFPSKNNFVKALLEKHPEITTIIQNVNDRPTNMVLGNKEHVLYGNGYIEDVLCGYRFRISPKSFYQVNPVQAEVLYKKVLELAKLNKKETVLDAYCGVGTIGIVASKYAGQVIGVELNKNAVKDAVQNAKQNDVTNIQFYCNDAGRFMSDMADKGDKVDVVLMDPPRSGSTKEFVDAVAAMGPERVVYVSCGPETLVRDLRMLRDAGYRAIEAWPVDMFPETKHVETVCLLSKLHTDHHIEVNLNIDELDLTSVESKATYDEIKDYVLENSGFKVSSLYIGQVKDKMGIKERENYNISKKEDAKVPKCPADKEKAIIAALKYFNMID